jgi:hypothetical protein
MSLHINIYMIKLIIIKNNYNWFFISHVHSRIYNKATEHIEKPHYYKAIALFIDNTSAIVESP